MNKYLIIILVFIGFNAMAIAPQVPAKMKFAGMELSISPAARKKIQASVDALVRSPKHFQIKVDRAHLYFPYIEKAFRDENLPEDFKYLVLQESGLVSDAVSSSNAIGFWQFKVPAATEAGLTIDKRMDERKHIVRASHGAAKYLKQNNVFFGNWVYALQAYNTGAGGAKKTANSKWFGKKKMDIESTTHWYVLKFLAHKVAFDDAFRQKDTQTLSLVEYKCNSESMQSIAKKFNIELSELKKYNKWLNIDKVPNDRKYYSVMIPVLKQNREDALEKAKDEVIHIAMEKEVEKTKKEEKIIKKAEKLPGWFLARKRRETTPDNPHIITKINGLVAIKAKQGDTKDILAINGGIRTKKLLKYNDIKSFEKIKIGEFYYLQAKNKSHYSRFHIVKPGETIWKIAQNYGIRMKSLLKRNRMKEYEQLKYGRQMYLKSMRPKGEKVIYKEIKIPEETLPKEVETERKIKKVEDIIKEIPKHEKVTIDTNAIIKEVEQEIKKDEEIHKTLKYHIVMQGESLFAISKMYNTTPEQILQWNDLPNNTISIGQKLIIGWEEDLFPIQENYTVHKVKQGETLYSISKIYGVSIPEILNWNKKESQSVNVDEEIRIKKK